VSLARFTPAAAKDLQRLFDLLTAINAPHYPEHSDMIDWIGCEFDPEALELAQVNQAL
jgi:hypothetical protein